MPPEVRQRFEICPRKYIEEQANIITLSEFGIIERTPFDVFDFDLEIPAKYANKMCSVYNVTPWRKFVVDYTGRRTECAELFGVALDPIGYQMKISPAFFAFLSDIENDAVKYRGGIGDKPECLKITPLD